MSDPRQIARETKPRPDTPRHTVAALWHFAATLLLDSQVPMLVVSRILGHSSVAITADIYGHVLEDTAREAMESLGSRVAFGA